MNVTLITPTGDRPEAWALCEKWMARQTRQPDRWLVGDDGEEPTVFTMGQQVHRVASLPKGSKKARVRRNFAQLLGHCPVSYDDVIVSIEDDDWYAPTYIEEMVAALERAGPPTSPLYGPLVSPQRMVMYHVRHRAVLGDGPFSEDWSQSASMIHPFQAAFSSVIAGRLRRTQVFDDLGTQLCYRDVPRCAVGMKGMPGRPNASAKPKNPSFWKQKADLAEIIGEEDAREYAQYATA